MAHLLVLVTARRLRLLPVVIGIFGPTPALSPVFDRGVGGDGHQREPTTWHGCGAFVAA
jgi:hypothetical protein